MKTKIIAYYLPQYHPIKENDEWWGKGFTEWTNVAKAKPLFRGHKQPNIPADLGFYDLRLPETRLAQANMAKKAGIYGFCYWHYWFGNGKQLLEQPLNEVVKSGEPNFPFCLGWANETWYAKVWNTKGNKKDKVLIEQTYPDKEDIIKHFKIVAPIIKDKRYITINDRPLFVIYKPLDIPNFPYFKTVWNTLLKESGIADSFYFIAYSIKDDDNKKIQQLGYDGINMVRYGAYRWNKHCAKDNLLRIIVHKLFNTPLRLKYSNMIKYFVGKSERNNENIFPTIVPNWDHTPRSGRKGFLYEGVTSKLFKKHVEEVLSVSESKPNNKNIAFLKSWNEWGEGNYMEPDLRNGTMLIDTLQNIVEKYDSI